MICAVVLWLISDSRRTGAIWHPQMWACSLRFLAEKNWPAGAVMLVWVTTCQCWSPKFGSTAASMRTVWQWEVHSTSALLEPLRARIKQDIGMQLWRVRAWMQLGNIHYKHETYGFPNMEDERQKKHSVSWSVQFHFSEETDAWAHVFTHAFHFFGSLSRPCPALRNPGMILVIAAGQRKQHFYGKVQLPSCTCCSKDATKIKGGQRQYVSFNLNWGNWGSQISVVNGRNWVFLVPVTWFRALWSEEPPVDEQRSWIAFCNHGWWCIYWAQELDWGQVPRGNRGSSQGIAARSAFQDLGRSGQKFAMPRPCGLQ